jgi:hypothetical protein
VNDSSLSLTEVHATIEREATTMNPINRFLLATMLVLPVGALYPTGQAAAFGAASSVDARIRLDWEVELGMVGRLFRGMSTMTIFAPPPTCCSWSKCWTPPAR